MIEFVQHFQEMPCGSGNPIERCHHQDIKLATPGICHKPIETWPFRFRPADYVAVFSNDFVATLSSHLAQVEQLGFRC
jgi:hypothetical protein